MYLTAFLCVILTNLIIFKPTIFQRHTKKPFIEWLHRLPGRGSNCTDHYRPTNLFVSEISLFYELFNTQTETHSIYDHIRQ
jgi:hypothetical protein